VTGSASGNGTGLLRRAGWGRLGAGRRLLWTVAEGERGRRWRSSIIDAAGRLERTLLLEVTSGGTIGRLELASAAGLLTLHPSHDGSAVHGNVATPMGMRHIALAWSATHRILVDGSPIGTAVVLTGLADTIGVGEGRIVPVLAVSDDLDAVPAVRRFARVGPGTWWVVDPAGGARDRVVLDERGVPVLDAHEEWPLEIEAP